MISSTQLAGLLGLPAPTDEQAAVIEAPAAPAVVIAGAGSGKTETMAARVVWLVANRCVAPAAVLGLTFTRKAAAELGRRIRWRLSQWRRVVERERPDDTEHLAELLGGEPTVLTYAAYASRLVGEHAMRVGAEPNPRLLSQAVCWQLADSVVRRYGGELPRGIGALASVPQYVLALTAQLADHLVEPDAVAEFGITLAERLRVVYGGDPPPTSDAGRLLESLRHRSALLPLVGEYAAGKQRMPAVDFGDEMALAARLAQLPDVARIERERFGAVLLDEYQDTGYAQAVMLAGLFGAGHTVTAVGDPFQSIYGWRGASAGNIGRFAATFGGAVTYPLSTSWRNDEVVLSAANAVAAPLRTGAATVELRARPGAGPGMIRAAVTETVEDEAQWLARRMRTEWEARPAGERTAAVLVRRRSQIDAVRMALLAEGLPVEVVGLGGLLTTPEVVDVVATLRVLADHKSGSALARLLTGARWRIGPRDLAALSDRARELARMRRVADVDDADDIDGLDQGSLIEALDDLGREGRYSPAGLARMRALSIELRALRRRLSAPLAELVADVEHVIGVDVEVAARADRAAVGRVHLDRFLDEAARFAADADEATLPAFLAFLDAAEVEENGLESGEVAVEKERVQILTVHGAKGLEWDVVAVPGLVAGVFPAEPRSVDWTRTRQLLPAPLRGDHGELPVLRLENASDRKQVGEVVKRHAAEVRERHRDEERRLAYVAFTRARSVLLVSGYTWDGAKSARAVSPFLDELREFAEVDEWFVPDDGAENPRLGEPAAARWPLDPLGARRADVEAGAELVRAALTAPAPAAGPAQLPGLLDDSSGRRDAWRHSVDLLLAERARLSAAGTVDVVLPGQLSVSQLVALRRDPGALARRLRRPLPSKPAPLARRGTAFHAWLEQRWSAQPLLDIDDLPGAADATADDSDLAALRAAFEASEWAERMPVEVEVPFEMAIDATVVRGRMDAVFKEADGYTVVDWKTGAPPTGADAQAAAVQLAAYRLAWAALSGVDVERIEAAFHYVRSNETISPVDLLDADGLRRLIVG